MVIQMNEEDLKLYRKINSELKLLVSNDPEIIQKGIDDAVMFVCGKRVIVITTDTLPQKSFQLTHSFWQSDSNHNFSKFMFLIGTALAN